MARFEETRLPGVGIRHDFVTEEGRRIGVITRHGGRRQLLIYAGDDPDKCSEVVHLSEGDRHAVVELLGGSQLTTTVTDVQQRVEGLAIDWLPIREDWAAAGHTITDTELRRRTGVSIVAVLRGTQTLPSPEPGQRLEVGDTVVVVGTPEGIERAETALRQG